MESRIPKVGVAAVIFKNGKVLLQLRRSSVEHAPGTWGFPGGNMEYGESPEEAAERETFEESWLMVRAKPGEKYYTNTVFPNGRHYITLYIPCEYLGGNPKVTEPTKCEKWEWFYPEALPSPLMECVDPNWIKAQCY